MCKNNEMKIKHEMEILKKCIMTMLGLSQQWKLFNIRNVCWCNTSYNINGLMEVMYMLTSIDAEKAFDNI